MKADHGLFGLEAFSASGLTVLEAHKSLGQYIGCLQIRCRTKRKTLFAVPALLRSNLRNKIYLPFWALIDKCKGVLLFYLSAIPYTKTTEDAE